MKGFLVDRRTRLLIASVAAVVLGVSIPLGIASVTDEFPRPDDVRGEPIATGPEMTLASGALGEQTWRLVVNDSDQGQCVHLELVSPQRARSGGCGLKVQGRGIGLFAANLPSGQTWVFGPVVRSATEVEVQLSDGTVRSVGVIDEPGGRWNFYVATYPRAVTPAAVVARGSRGDIVGRQAIS